ncbi:hypothetical protein [Nostoc sp. FACHB-280]|nr:hypothetical protein [Nostoc sp. FACHB-280]
MTLISCGVAHLAFSHTCRSCDAGGSKGDRSLSESWVSLGIF